MQYYKYICLFLAILVFCFFIILVYFIIYLYILSIIFIYYKWFYLKGRMLSLESLERLK